MDAEATRIRLKKHAPAHGMEVGRVKVVMPGDGGHHVGLFWPHAGTLEWSKTQCLSLDVQGDPWEPIAVSQHPLLDWRLPPGVAMKLKPRQPLLVQTHYFKSSVGKRKARKWEPKTELYPVDPRTVTAHAGTLVLNDRVTDLPRGVRSRPAAAPSPERGPTLASFGSSPSAGTTTSAGAPSRPTA